MNVAAQDWLAHGRLRQQAQNVKIIIIFLARTPAFVWVYPWWGALPVFVTVYIPFFAVSMFSYDWRPATQVRVIGALFTLDALLLIIFAGVLRWI